MPHEPQARLPLPYLAAGQAQKDVTRMRRCRASTQWVQISILSHTIATAPASNTAGQCNIVPANATGILGPA